jgi:large subunit ribosomal protein L25
MQITPLKARTRTDQGKGPARRLRAEGQLPAVAYGGGGDTVALSVQADALRAILVSERGRNTVIQLEIEGRDGFAAMVKDYEVHPLSRRLLHADFIRIDEKKPVEVVVPFASTGRSKGELEGGTVLVALRLLPVRCLADRIPDRIEHDVSELEINDVIKVSDLVLTEGVEVLLPPDRRIVVVQPPRVEAEKPAEGEGVEGAEGEAAAEGAEGAEGEKAEGAKKGDG